MNPTIIGLICLLALCTFVQFNTVGQVLTVSQSDLKAYLKEFSRPRSHNQPEEKNRVRNYIKSFFSNLGTSTTRKVKTYTFPTTSYGNGSNIVYTMRGSNWGTSADNVLLVGTHYDSQSDTPGVDDNGSGMAAMLAIAKLLSQVSKRYSIKSTVVFAAFDFEEFGLLGSEHFVKKVLMEDIVNPSTGTFHGAIILETMMNYNTSSNSQTVPPGFKSIFPEAKKRLEANNNRGDFLLTIGRLDEAKIQQNLTTLWDKTTKDMNYSSPFSLTLPVRGRLDFSNPQLRSYRDLFRSDHVDFWQSQANLKAVQITDSANFRGYMIECYHKPCDKLSNVTPEMYQFLTCSTQTIFNYVFQVATGQKPQGTCPPPTTGPIGTASTMSMSTFAGCMAMLLAHTGLL